ncbi:hypothetical protein ACI8B_180272 [Acinetobacter proteolyticus]|uniref:Uncharacterized protein n=1 Tax=Acinetobacter proteolyticus TaxID=1776741 RepID=A0A653K2X9_9GAMM|nr:hypothetical protein ACI8B_180272 [Acinetobacter proteolyticus]
MNRFSIFTLIFTHLHCLHNGYINLANKKALTINACKCLIYGGPTVT